MGTFSYAMYIHVQKYIPGSSRFLENGVRECSGVW